MFISSTRLTYKLLGISLTCILAGLICLQIPFFYRPLAQYAQNSMEEYYGSSAISPIYEDKITEIAKSMGITQPIIIRKMNTNALLTMGYYNAFATFHLFCSYFPLIDTPFLFISEGFFEDLPEEEQRFLIGHELTHIKGHHTRYLNLCAALFFITFLVFLRFFFKNRYLSPLMSAYIPAHYHSLTRRLLNVCGIWLCFLTTYIGICTYRKHIEWQADTYSLAHLQSHEGGIKLMERWQRDYYMAAVNPCWGLFSDHPTCFERRTYFIEHKTT